MTGPDELKASSMETSVSNESWKNSDRFRSSVILARSGVAAAVRLGAPKPDIGSVGAPRETLLADKSVAYPVADAIPANERGLGLSGRLRPFALPPISRRATDVSLGSLAGIF
jgi:hypothetical protein